MFIKKLEEVDVTIIILK